MTEEDRYDVVLKTIQKDPLSADLLLSVLIAASSSYRHDTVLRPFPPQYSSENEEEKNYQELVGYRNPYSRRKYVYQLIMCNQNLREKGTAEQKKILN